MALVPGLAHGQTPCPALTFQAAASATLKPSSTTHTALLRQNDGSYTAFELTDAAPYRIVRVTRDFQKQLRGCPGPAANGSAPVVQPPEAITPLPGGGYLWVRRNDVNAPAGSRFAITAAAFDSKLNLVSEAEFNLGPVQTLTVADVNGDGLPDIIAGTVLPATRSSGIQVLLGAGGAKFQPPVTYPIAPFLSESAQRLTVADVNADGKLDVVIASTYLTGKVSVFLGKGDGTFAPELVALLDTSFDAIAIADLNHDGKPDLAYTTRNSAVIALGKGDGTFTAGTPIPVNASDAIAIADMDGDGIPDVVVSSFTILFGDGTGRFPRRADYWVQTAGDIILADFDGDGKVDIVTGTGTAQAIVGPAVSVMFGLGNGKFDGPPVSQANLVSTLGVAADFDGDGKPDMLAGAADSLTLLKGVGDGTFRQGPTYSLGRDGYPGLRSSI